MKDPQWYPWVTVILLCVIMMGGVLVRKGVGMFWGGKSSEYHEIHPERRILQGHKINLNEASRHELMALPGIGPKRAQKILALRSEMGAFSNLDDLEAISGISTRLLDQWAPYVVIRSPHEKQPQ